MTYVEFASGPNTLRGMLHLPEGARRPHPCMVFLHGLGGCRTESHFLFVAMARRLERRGVASLRFDFAGSGESDGDFADMTAGGELADAEAALDFLRRHAAIDARRIGACGLSLGGCVAALLAGRPATDLRAVVLLAAVADTPRTAAMITFGELQEQLASRGWMDIGGLKVSRAFIEDFIRREPVEALRQFPGQTLIVHGSDDTTVPAAQAEQFHQARQAAGLPSRLEIIADADHTFERVEWTERVLSIVEEFVPAAL